MKIFGTSIPPVTLSVAILAVATTAVVYSPTLYRMFCEATGYGGTVSVSRALNVEESAIGPAIKVRFDANISPGLDWDFRPAQREVETHIGVPTTVFYHATNNSDETLVGRATYNVTPDTAGYYFNKTDCFCFVEQKLAPGESAEMPIVFFIDPDMVEDVDAKHIRVITLSYTFFRQASDEEAIAAARPLREGSEAQVRELSSAETAEFTNHVQRRQ
ncbi:cytochrome c oxidase assembly protein CtaG/Cox11 [Parvibaculum lavamentivorans DS-1]|uniref:Cytochrome c oxidase assembly protein CtaG n=1 Tax=Parvibaculum lavamentivorans (strain DS-1 / DSM 13023 / NCIMB 13966) TaxID=402881 RepID=A7HUB6_PARL1|nr:cytochrome c oxidase assembly protein [Parvibaculum lavamentivorans]ABS63499.1 cytochrome c oxidase assembly protein CtaG/Cox11 [Parvibaculum lavamentivorans DS-1]